MNLTDEDRRANEEAMHAAGAIPYALAFVLLAIIGGALIWWAWLV